MTFKNKNFKTRDYEATNIVACVAETAPAEYYVPASESVLNGLTKLWAESFNGQQVTYCGWL